MKAKQCLVIGNTSWGYCFSPERFSSIKKAKEYAREMIYEGYWFAYRIKVIN